MLQNGADFDQIKREIDLNQGIMTVSMERLRDAAGAKKLGKFVVQQISDELNGRGIGHYPDTLSTYQHHFARLFSLGGRAEKLIKAVLVTGEAEDAVIREATGGDAADKLKKIRFIVCD